VIEWFAGLAGLLPFAHTNLILQFVEGDALLVSVIAFSHLGFESIPAVFFSLPGAAHSASVLPAHALALKGQATAAFQSVLRGLVEGLFWAVPLYPLALLAYPLAHPFFKEWSWLVLTALCLAFFWSEKRVQGVLVFALSGALGFLCFSFFENALFPLLTGLFGVPLLLTSSGKAVAEGEPVELKPGKNCFFGAIAGAVSPLLPAVNPALLASSAFLFLEGDSWAYLFFASALASSKTVFDFTAKSVLGVSRSGAAAAFQGGGAVEVLAGAATLLVAVALLLFFSRPLTRLAAKLNKPKLFFVAVITIAFFLGGWSSLFVLASASCIGLLALECGVRKANAAGALVLPSILYSTGAGAALLSALV
jgi:TctA family transporter